MNIRLTWTLDDFPADVHQIPYSGLESIGWTRCGTLSDGYARMAMPTPGTGQEPSWIYQQRTCGVL